MVTNYTTVEKNNKLQSSLQSAQRLKRFIYDLSTNGANGTILKSSK